MKETYLNAPVKSCSTCVHCVPDEYLGEEWSECRRWRCSTRAAVFFRNCCGKELREWRAKPPEPPAKQRRSLRQWLYDFLWA